MFVTVTSVILPMRVCPARTVPSVPTETLFGSVPAGIRIGGTSRSPDCVTTSPFASVVKSPERVSATDPSERRTWKYPGRRWPSRAGRPSP